MAIPMLLFLASGRIVSFLEKESQFKPRSRRRQVRETSVDEALVFPGGQTVPGFESSWY
jgi:hypothetical protein